MIKFPVAEAKVAGLIGAVVHSCDGATTLAGRRERIIRAIGELTRSDCGLWAWGRGHYSRESIAPVAIVPFGFDVESSGRFIQGAFRPQAFGPWCDRVMSGMEASAASTRSRTDLYDDPEWDDDPSCAWLRRMGMDEWLHSVRYSASDTWSNMFLARRRPSVPYTAAQRDLLDLAMTSISWLHATHEESVPPEAFEDLTLRQRSILLMLLDGRARKSIAAQLRIAEDTVGDHIKSIYRTFEVNSVAELASLFLKSR